MYEFKLNYYFEVFKDAPFDNRKKFRERFIKKFGKFQFLEELIIIVKRYQIKKYGSLRNSAKDRKSKEEYIRIVVASNKRERYRKNK